MTVPGYGWRHQPTVATWAGYEQALVRYGLDVCAARCARGKADTCAATAALVRDLARRPASRLFARRRPS